jgi:hypothetical protein
MTDLAQWILIGASMFANVAQLAINRLLRNMINTMGERISRVIDRVTDR